jgi:peptidyl-prolyl cis-trans isomerase C
MGGAVVKRVVLGLAVIALGAATAAAQAPTANRARTRAAQDTVLVRIGTETITRAQLRQRLEDLPEPYRANYNTPETRQQLLDRMVEERIWSMMARKRGIPERPDIKRQLEHQQRDLLIRTYINEMMAANTAPSDSEARAYYDAHRADYKLPATVTVAHIQTKTEAEGRRIKQWAVGKQDWKKLAQRYSTDTLSRAGGGALGTVTRDGVFGSLGPQPALAESAFALGEGGIGGPYRSARGWHVLKVESMRHETTRAFDQVRNIIVRQLGNQRSQDFYRARLDDAKKDLGVKADSTAIRSFLFARKTARDLFKEAQEAGAPAARIAGYEALLREYPESEVSPQAQFMIGFIHSEELKQYPQAEAAFQQLITRYPKSELVESARWMLANMRSEEAPPFLNLEAAGSGAKADSATRRPAPPRSRPGR